MAGEIFQQARAGLSAVKIDFGFIFVIVGPWLNHGTQVATHIELPAASERVQVAQAL
jgi:hypothetical protein